MNTDASNLMRRTRSKVGTFSAGSRPNNASAYFGRGVSEERKGDYSLAIASYDHAVANDPKNAAAWLNRANLYESKGDHGQAITSYNHSSPRLTIRGRLSLLA